MPRYYLVVTCWVRGTEVASTFDVKVSTTETVAALKEAIKEKKPATFRDVDANSLLLYRLTNPVPTPYRENLSRIILSEHGELLEMAQNKLSEVFPGSPTERHVHIIVDAPYLMIVCWLRGSTLDASVEISIRANATPSELKDRIKEAKLKLRNVDGEHIRLYRISGDEDEVQESLTRKGDGNPLRGHTLLPNFLGVPVLNPFYVVAEYISSTNDRTTLLQGRQDDIPTGMTESSKRTTTITSKSLTPSQAAKSSEYLKIQSGDRRLFDCCCAASNPVNTVAPPIQLFNPAFTYFSSKAFDPDYDVPDDLVLNARDLMVQFALIHPNEDARRHRLKSYLQKAIRHPLTFIINSDRTAPNVVALSSCEELQVYLIVGEEKNEFGDGGSDPSVQAAFSFLRILSQKENSEVCLRCCYPTFIIAHAGPWLTIMGGIFTARCIVQRLTDFLWVPAHSTHDDDQCRRIARVLYALRESIQCLDSWYKTIKDVPPFNSPAPARHPRFFPSPNTYERYDGALVKFAYQEPLERNVSCVTYLAKTIEDNSKDIVVKFVTSYGADAHRKMASTGFAPQLLYYGPVNVTPDMPSYGNLRMVVMEYVKGLTFEDALKQRDIHQKFKDDLHQALEQLHSADYVFGDLRQPNVIITPERRSMAQLIDFDWAGKEGEVKYPVSISSSIDWPEGVHGLASIQKEHDLAMLNSLMSHWS